MQCHYNKDKHLLCLGIFCCCFVISLIILLGEFHFHRGLCINNYGNGFVNPNTYYSPCHKPYLETGKFAPDKGASWYFYKLIDTKLSSSIIIWSFYAIHLFLNWYIIYCVQYEKEEVERLKLNQFNIKTYKTVDVDRDFLHDHMRFNKVEMESKHANNSHTTYNHNDNLLAIVPKLQEKYSNTLKWYNWTIFSINLIAYFIHLITTHTIYDGLASNVSIWSSQACILYLTVIIFIFRIPLRGLIFGVTFNETLDGKCFKNILNIKNLIFALKKYHSYMFIWAIVYTFWYHPMEPLFGHLTGFSFLFLIFLQTSLLYTNLHSNIVWTVFIECYFVFHVSTTTIQNSPKWKTYTNGLLLVYTITVIPLLIDYLYKKRYKTSSPLYWRIIPSILAFIFATLLRCVMDECEWRYLSKDYQFVGYYYIGIPVVIILMGISLKVISYYVTNNKYILCAVMMMLFGVLNCFCYYAQHKHLTSLCVTICVWIIMISIQIMITKWWWRLILI